MEREKRECVIDERNEVGIGASFSRTAIFTGELKPTPHLERVASWTLICVMWMLLCWQLEQFPPAMDPSHVHSLKMSLSASMTALHHWKVS
jgi:hypothetical protein